MSTQLSKYEGQSLPAGPAGEFAKEQPASVANRPDAGIASGSGSANPQTTEDRPSGTLSETDKVADAVLVSSWTKFADLGVEQKFEQARLMTFEERDAYLHERCLAAKIEVQSAASALDRATTIIEANLPFFVVHFEELDMRGRRSDLKGKVVGKTEWLARNMPEISRGTFYAAYNAVKARLAEHSKMLTEGQQPEQHAGVQDRTLSVPDKVATTQPQPKPNLKVTQRDLNRMINVGREAAQVAEIGLKQNKNDYRALHESYKKIAKLAKPQKLDSLMAESAKETEADIQRGKAINAAKRLAELTLGWCKLCDDQVRSDSKLLGIARAAQTVMNLINGTRDEFALPHTDTRERPNARASRVTAGSAPPKTTREIGTAPVTKNTTPQSPAELPAIHEAKIKPGFTCKYNGIDCEVTQVFGNGEVSLARLKDSEHGKAGEAVGRVPVNEIRYVTDPDAVVL